MSATVDIHWIYIQKIALVALAVLTSDLHVESLD